MTREPVRVEVGACRCPGTPHPDGDYVLLSPVITIQMGSAAEAALRESGEDAVRLEAALTDVCLLGVVGWSFIDELRRPLRISPQAITDLVPWEQGGFELNQKLNELYATGLFAPLRKRLSTLSQDGSTDASTSANENSGPQRPKRSKRSLPPVSDGKPSEAQGN